MNADSARSHAPQALDTQALDTQPPDTRPPARQSLPGGIWLPVLILLVVLVATYLLIPAEKAPFIYAFF